MYMYCTVYPTSISSNRNNFHVNIHITYVLLHWFLRTQKKKYNTVTICSATLTVSHHHSSSDQRPSLAGVGCTLAGVGCKKLTIFPSPARISLIKLFPARERLVSDIPAGEGEIVNLFLRCRCSRPVIVDIAVMAVMLYCRTRTGKEDIAFLLSLVPLKAK